MRGTHEQGQSPVYQESGCVGEEEEEGRREGGREGGREEEEEEEGFVCQSEGDVMMCRGGVCMEGKVEDINMEVEEE